MHEATTKKSLDRLGELLSKSDDAPANSDETSVERLAALIKSQKNFQPLTNVDHDLSGYKSGSDLDSNVEEIDNGNA